jgi:hypothetical protein
MGLQNILYRRVKNIPHQVHTQLGCDKVVQYTRKKRFGQTCCFYLQCSRTNKVGGGGGPALLGDPRDKGGTFF